MHKTNQIAIFVDERIECRSPGEVASFDEGVATGKCSPNLNFVAFQPLEVGDGGIARTQIRNTTCGSQYELVCPSSTREGVVFKLRAAEAVEEVIACFPIESVAAPAAIELVVAGIAPQDIVAGFSVEAVIARPTIYSIVAPASVDNVVTAASIDVVVKNCAVDLRAESAVVEGIIVIEDSAVDVSHFRDS